jgi:hypothetical protein
MANRYTLAIAAALTLGAASAAWAQDANGSSNATPSAMSDSASQKHHSKTGGMTSGRSAAGAANSDTGGSPNSSQTGGKAGVGAPTGGGQ